MKNLRRIVTILLTMAMIMTFATSAMAVSFSDLDASHWAYENIMTLAENGIINGYENGTYQPERTVSRGEFIKLAMTTLYNGNEYFEINNINLGHWASSYAVEAAVQGYLMNGTSIDNLNDAITRLEMANILAKICVLNKINGTGKGSDFSDIAELDATNQNYIKIVSMNGLINGYTDGTFKADKNMTRAEVATVIIRFQNLLWRGAR